MPYGSCSRILTGKGLKIDPFRYNKQSLEELAPIVKTLMEVKGNSLSETPIMLVGNKSDDNTRREVATETGSKLAAKWGTGFIETSAKNNDNITELFQQLLALEKKRTLTLTMEDPDGKGAKRKGGSSYCSSLRHTRDISFAYVILQLAMFDYVWCL
ncbi:hypothetical protein Y032_1078g3557 [Ancylostoma ceylanicum]|uniref:Ras family protein n=1 Tax=Ancylostoma ceylanicum TaxID=53326 RepID=A0A016W6V2_9BILA|nr:hypothetical protein Y032_1078g3557 [Ancylostoma ceylanicum]